MKTINYPEMQGYLEANIQAVNTCLSKKPYRVISKFPLPIKQGVESAGFVSKIGANNIPNKNAGYCKYYMTSSAFEKLCENNNVVLNILLD